MVGITLGGEDLYVTGEKNSLLSDEKMVEYDDVGNYTVASLPVPECPVHTHLLSNLKSYYIVFPRLNAGSERIACLIQINVRACVCLCVCGGVYTESCFE